MINYSIVRFGWFVSRITQTLLNETLIDEGSLLRIHPINFLFGSE